MRRRALWLGSGSRREANLLWLTPNLAIGGADGRQAWRHAYLSGVRAVVELGNLATGSGSMVRGEGMRYLYLPVPAGFHPTADDLQVVTGWIIDREAEGRVLIQDNRACFDDALVAAAVLIRDGLPPHLALLALRRVRPDAALDYEQSGVLVQFAGAIAVAD